MSESLASFREFAEWMTSTKRLHQMTSQELVQLALEHMPEAVSDTPYEQIVWELCARVDATFVEKLCAQTENALTEATS